MGATDVQTPQAPTRPGTPAARLEALAGRPWLGVLVVTAVIVAMGWQFFTDASRAVPALDTAYYQWRVEYLMEQDPGAMIELRGAIGALAGGYRIAEPVAGALMRTVGGVAAVVPTIVLSIFFRVLAGVGMAAFAWRHRRNWLLFYLTILATPAVFLLQRFFGYMDNFMSLALLAGVLLLMDRMQESWGARIAATLFMFLVGLSHPTTLVIFLLSMGAVAGYRLLRERSLLAALRSEGMIIVTGTVSVILTAAFWMGGLWGPRSSFSDAAVPPPADIEYFVNRSISVLKSLEPFYPLLILVPLMAVALGHLLVRVIRRKEYFSELASAWTLPLLGMLGFLIGAAYPYFRFFNATLAPEMLAALGLFLVIWGASRVRGGAGRALTAVAVVAVGFALATWWSKGLAAWNAGGTWLTPEVRQTTAAASAYLEATPEDERALFVVDAQGPAPLPYGEYKNFANAIYAGIDGDQIADVSIFYGTIEDLEAGRASTIGDEVYDDISADTADEVRPVLRSEMGNLAVFMPSFMNEETTNADFLASCSSEECVEVGDTGLFLVPAAGDTPVDSDALDEASNQAAEARAFADDPPGPLAGLGGTLLSFLRLALLLIVPGWLFYRRLDRRSWPEALALIPLFSVASVTTVGVLLVAVVRGPFTPAVGWISWAIAVALALFGRLPEGLRRRRERLFAAPARLVDETSEPFRNRNFTFLMGAQWLGQMADGLVAATMAKLITFGGEAGFDAESARTTRDALFIVLMTFLPYTLFSPLVGVLIDRWNRRRLLIGANALRAVVLALILVLGLERIGDPALYVSLLLVLAGTRILLAIKGASLPAVLDERNLMQGNAISQAGSALFQLFGAGVALVAAEQVDAPPILVAGVLVYAVATLAAAGTRKLGYAQRTVPLSQEIGRLLRDLRDGVVEVTRRAAAGIALSSFLVVRSMLTMTVLATGFLSRRFIAEESSTAVVAGAVGALGAGLGFVLAHVLKDRVAPSRIVSAALILGGAGMMGFGGIITLVGISLMAFTVGLSFFLGKVGVDTMMQQALDDAFRGRGFSFQDIAYNLSWITPALVLFLFLDAGTARFMLVVAGAVFLVLAVAVALWARRVPAEARG